MSDAGGVGSLPEPLRRWRRAVAPRLIIARRELATLRTEKTIVLALAIQLFVAGFSSFLVVGLVSMYDPASAGGYAVDAAVTGDARADLLTAVERQPGVRGSEYASTSDARAAFERGEVDVLLEATERRGRVHVVAVVPDSSVRATLVVTRAREALRAYERAERKQRAAYLTRRPLEPPHETPASPYFGFTYTVLVPLLLFLPVFIGGSISVDSLTEERERGTLELLRATPVTLTAIVDGKALAAVALAPAQAALWLALLWVNGTAIANAGPLLLVVTAFATLVVALGVAVSLLAPDRRAAQFLYSVGVLALFGAGALLPSGPANTVALLSIDSATAATYVRVAVFVVLAVGSALGVRALVESVDASAL